MSSPSIILPRIGRPPLLDDLELADLEAMRLLLRGDSVVDWHRLGFTDYSEIDRFLRVNEFNPESEDELGRLEDLRLDAVDYLTRVYSMQIPAEIAEEVAARDLLLVASRHGPLRTWACVVLKVMHIIHHIAGRAALTKISISDEAIYREVELKVMGVVEELRAAGAPIAEFEWSRKPRDSQITKLMAKRSTIAASIYDKLRFRLIVPKFDDLVPTVATLIRQLIPFNYVVPGESVNQLIDMRRVLASLRRRDLVTAMQDLQSDDDALPFNEFSSPEYRVVNFIADLPLRLDRLIPEADIPQDGSHVIFVLTEFQIADKDTAVANESGTSSHEEYKARQHDRVRLRLFRGEPSATVSPPPPERKPSDHS